MVGCLAAAQRTMEDQRQLLAHAFLPDEVIEPLRPKRGLNHLFLGAVGAGGDKPLVVAHLLSFLSADFSSAATGGVSVPSKSVATASTAASASLADQPRLISPAWTCPRQVSARAGART